MDPKDPNPTAPPVLLTTKQVAHILQWNPFTITKKAERGELPGFKMGRGWRFRQEDIVAWIERQRNSAPPGAHPKRRGEKIDGH